MFQIEKKSNSSPGNKNQKNKNTQANSRHYYTIMQQQNRALNSINASVQLKEEEKEDPLQAKTAPVQRMVKEEEEKPVQAKTAPSQMMARKEEEEKTQMKQGGEETGTDQHSTPVFSKMNQAIQEKMESSFGTGFSDVNIIHNDPSAKHMRALAYTQGKDVHFAPGQYNPGTQKGQELLGHELTHVVQQRQGRVSKTNTTDAKTSAVNTSYDKASAIKQGKGMAINDNLALETEAEDMGKKAANGQSVDIVGRGSGVQRKDDNAKTFIVPQGWGLIKIADHLGVTVEDLKAANRDKLKKWGNVEGFNAGEIVNVPPNKVSIQEISDTDTATGDQGSVDETVNSQADPETTRDQELVYGTKVSREFRIKVNEIASYLGADPNHLMAIMAFESGGTFSPSVKNAAGSGATGLIQFMPSTARSLGTTTDDLAKMTALEQLDYVKKYFEWKKGNLNTIDDFYMAVLWPAACGQPEDYVLFSEGSRAYEQNKGLDTNNDGKITKAEASDRVRQTLTAGESLKNTIAEEQAQTTEPTNTTEQERSGSNAAPTDSEPNLVSPEVTEEMNAKLTEAQSGMVMDEDSGWGKVIGDVHGIQIRENNILLDNKITEKFPNFHVGDSVYMNWLLGPYGYMYQCVELVNRYYAARLGQINMIGSGDAKSYLDNNKRGHLDKFEFPTEIKPQPGDLIVKTESTYGHVGIVKDVDGGEENGTIHIAEQNSGRGPVMSKPLTKDPEGKWSVSGYAWKGFRRVKGMTPENRTENNHPEESETQGQTVPTAAFSSWTGTHQVLSGQTPDEIAKLYNITIEQLRQANIDKWKTWTANVSGFNAGATIKVPQPNKQNANGTNPDERIQTLYQDYFDKKIDILQLGKALIPYTSVSGKLIETLFDKLPATERDNLSFVLAANSSDTMLRSFDKNLLKRMSSELGNVFLTISWSENFEQQKRVKNALNEPVANTGTENQEKTSDTASESPESVYASQLDNNFNQSDVFESYTDQIKGSNMCNVTTLAMQLKYLASDDAVLKNAAIDLLIDKGYPGSKESLGNEQLEDILIRIFDQLGDQYFKDKLNITPNSDFGPHQYASALNHVGAMFTNYVSNTKTLYSVTTKDKYNTEVKPAVDSGAAVMLSTRLTGGHIVFLGSIKTDGITILDPYGMRMPEGYVQNGYTVASRKARITGAKSTFERRTKHNTSLRDEINSKIEKGTGSFGHNLGYENFFSWQEVADYDMGKWINILYKK